MPRRLLGNGLMVATAAGLTVLVCAEADPDTLPPSQARAPGVGKGAAAAAAQPKFLTASIQRGTLDQVITATGALQPVDTVEVGSQLAGQIDRLFVDFNDTVRSGDPLARIDQRTFRARVDEARSALEMAVSNVRVQQAKLDRAKIDLDNARAGKAVLGAKQDNARALLGAAERSVERKLTLRLREVASATAVEEAQTELATKRALLRETTTLLDMNAFAVDGAGADVRRLEAELAQARSAVPQREALLRVAEIDLDRTTIRSPTDGVVVGRFVNQGQTLASGLEARPAFSIARNLGEMEIHARVDETDIGRVMAGQAVSFTVDAYPERRFNATVRQVRKAPQVSQNVVTYTVVLTTSNREGLLLPGMTALAKLTVHHDEDVLKIPLAALRFNPSPRTAAAPAGRGKAQSVWVATATGALQPVPVTTGATSADLVALKAGSLSEGDRVVVGQAEEEVRREIFGIRLWF